MEVLFSFGAFFIGLRVRYWFAAAVAAAHLIAVTLVVIALAGKTGALILPANALYFAAVISGIVMYLRGRKLPREHDRRETCELLGAVGFLGLLGVVIGVAIATAAV